MSTKFTSKDIEDIAAGLRRGTQLMQEMTQRQNPPEGGDLSGDREPRNPLPIVPQVGAIALELIDNE